MSSGGAPSGITSILSGQEEMFAFQRAVSSNSSVLLVASCDIIIMTCSAFIEGFVGIKFEQISLQYYLVGFHTTIWLWSLLL